jgi:hypothetical protein
MMDQPRAHGNAVQRLCRLAARYVRQRTDDGQTSVHAGQEPETLTGINGARRETAILLPLAERSPTCNPI